MTPQSIYLFGLVVLGIGLGFPFKDRVPFPFICLTGYLWGALAWVLGGLLLLLLGLPYTLISTVIVLLLVCAGAMLVAARRGAWRLSRSEALWFISTLAASLVVSTLVTRFNLSVVNNDSLSQIIVGRNLAHDGFTRWNQGVLTDWGVFLPLVQSASVFVGEDYLYAFQPTLSLSFVAVFVYLCYRATRHRIAGWQFALAIVPTLILLMGTAFLIFQIFLVHNNFPSSTYLLVAVGCFWLGLREGDNGWLVFGIAGLLGFSLLRIEAPLFALMIGAFALSGNPLTAAARRRYSLPFLLILAVWYGHFLTVNSPVDGYLSPFFALLFVGAFVLSAILLSSRIGVVEHTVLPNLHLLAVGAVVLMLVIGLATKPARMVDSLNSMLINTVILGDEVLAYYDWWGFTWYILLAMIPLFFVKPAIPYERFLVLSSVMPIVLTLAIVVGRGPYRVSWEDSSHRMLTHVLPLFFLAFFVKAAWILTPNRSDRILEASAKGAG